MININLPAGLSHGVEVSMNGNGDFIRGGDYGDLFILIEESELGERYERNGSDVIINKYLNISANNFLQLEHVFQRWQSSGHLFR